MRRSTQRQVDGSNPTPGTAGYGYDVQDRLTSAKHPFELVTAGYTLDDAGNIITETGNPAGTGEFTYSFTDNRLITRTPTDPAGACTRERTRRGSSMTGTDIVLSATWGTMKAGV